MAPHPNHSFFIHDKECPAYIAYHLSISPRLAIFTVIVASVYLFQQSTSDSMASSASTRNLTTDGPMDGRTDSVLNIGLETPTRHAPKERNCDPWKLSLFISVTLLLAAVSVIVYLLIVQRQTPAECQPESKLEHSGYHT